MFNTQLLRRVPINLKGRNKVEMYIEKLRVLVHTNIISYVYASNLKNF